MADTHRIIVDLTQLAHWSGKITGIPRVMDELAKGFYGDADAGPVLFAVWVKDLQDFCEIDFEQTILRRAGLVYKRPGDPDGAGGEAVHTQIRTASASVRPAAPQLVKRAVRKGLRVTGRFSPRVAAKIEARTKRMQMARYKRIGFQRDDILFIPWGEWWDPTFTNRLVRAHTEQGVRLVQVIHDIATTVWPQFYERVEVNPTTYNARILPLADLVLCVSQNTRKELVGWMKQQKLPVPRIEVFRLGDVLENVKPAKPTEEAFMRSGLKGQDYIMCVGTIEAKKNHAMFYYVYKWAALKGIPLPKLVIVGRRGYGTENIYSIMTNDPEVKSRFVFLHDASDANLSWLYDHCLFTALPSFHEGWGIPIAESIARGVPCVCSNTSSMTEIAEGFVEHFSPYSTDECLAAIQKLLDAATRKKAAVRTKQYKQTPWNDTYKQVKAYLESV